MFDKLIDLLVSVWKEFQPLIFVLEYKEGVMFRAGKFRKVWLPGPHLRIPFVDSYYTENVKTDTMRVEEVNITTLDGKTVTIGCEFELKITDIIKAVVDTNDWRSNMHDIAQGILSDNLEDIAWDDIRKKTTKNAIAKKIEHRAFEMGITTNNFNFTDKAITRAITLFNNKTF